MHCTRKQLTLLFFSCFKLVLKMGNYMNKGNSRVGSATAFKIEYLNKVGLVFIFVFSFVCRFCFCKIDSYSLLASLPGRFNLYESLVNISFPFIHKQLSNTKTSDNKSTLLHFLVQSIEGKCPEVLNIKDEISSVPIAAKGRKLHSFFFVDWFVFSYFMIKWKITIMVLSSVFVKTKSK